MARYRTGTVTVTANNPVILGAGTAFVDAGIRPGDNFYFQDGRSQEIASVTDNTHLSLFEAPVGTPGATQPYSIGSSQSFAAYLANAFDGYKTTAASLLNGVGLGIFAGGSNAIPGFRFAEDQDTGVTNPGPNEYAFVTGGVERGRFTAAGNLGVGTTVPYCRIEARSTDQSNARIGIINTGSGGRVFHMVSGVDGLTNAGFSLFDASAGATRFVVTDAGNFGVGTNAPTARMHVKADNNILRLESTAPRGAGQNYLSFSDPSGAKGFLGFADNVADNFYVSNQLSGPIIFQTAGVEYARISGTGNLLVGAASGASHKIQKGGGEGAQILDIFGSAAFFNTNGGAGSASASAVIVATNTTTGRSINTGGTINASGADMAEYKRKAAGCGPIAKGDVVGVTAGNELTKTWGASIDFVIKTTRPHTVGGDTWGAEDSVTPDGEPIGKRPIKPDEVALIDDTPVVVEPFDEPEPEAFDEPEPETPIAPAAFDEAPPADASDEDVALWAERESAARMERFRYLAAMKPVEAWQERRNAATAAHAAWVERKTAAEAAQEAAAEREAAIAQNRIDRAAWEAANAAYADDLAAWQARHDAARANVDRVAIAGQCPVNIDGDFAPGDFVVAMPSGSGIKAVAMSPADFVAQPALVQLRKVARVWGVTEEFRETIDGVDTLVWPAGLAWCVVSVG